MKREQAIMQVAWNQASTAIYNADYALSNCYHGNGDEHDQRVNEMRVFLKTLDLTTGRWPEFHKIVYK